MRALVRFGVIVVGVGAAVFVARLVVAERAPDVHVDPNDPCTLLVGGDFSEAGLVPGEPARNDSPAGNGCAWSPVLGKGGAVRVQILSLETYGKRKAMDERALKPVTELGDEAFSIAGMSGEQLYVKKGQRAFRIDGDGRFDRAALRPLARAVADRL